MKIYFFESNQSDEVALRQLITQDADLNAQHVETVFISEPLTVATVSKAVDADVVSTFVHSVVDTSVLSQLPKTKLITTRSTGFDNIDLIKAKELGITVCNVPAYGSRTVAEYAFSLILGLSRKTFSATLQIKNRHDFSMAGFEGFNLQGKTLGIIGTGRIGLNVAKLGRGFDMKILGFDAFPNVAVATEIGFTYVDFDTLLSSSDVISIHVPYMKSTHHMLNDAVFSKMKKGMVLVNTSRGEVIDTEALIRALDAKIVAAAGLDVIEGERDLADEWMLVGQKNAPAGADIADTHIKAYKTLLEDHILIDRPEVFITPHIAFFSVEAKHEILQTTISNISGFTKNIPVNTVKIPQ